MQERRICDLSQLKATLKNKTLLESKQKELTELFKLFFTHSPKPIVTAQEFASTLAQRTQILKQNLLDFKTHQKIQSIYNIFKQELYKDLEFDLFCDSIAQSLTYSLFLARLNSKNEKIDLHNVEKFIPQSFPLIQAISQFLKDLNKIKSIKWLLDEILHIINHINISAIIEELNKGSEQNFIDYPHKDPYIHFYETFLSQYDPALRKNRGVYYTPISIVRFIINAIDSVLKNDFAFKEGLSTALFQQNITLLDFATGTGTFLLEAFRKALESISPNSPYHDPKILLKQFFGFEFLIAPYTIAHLKLSQNFKEEFNAKLNDNERLGIYLTNTLQNIPPKDTQDTQINYFHELTAESASAQNIKENSILIITGNPPYMGSSINAYDYVWEELQHTKRQGKDTKITKVQNKIQFEYFYCGLDSKKKPIHIKEKNPKWLQDDYVKFIHFAQNKIQGQEQGIIAIITNHSFLDNPTFRGMRWNLQNTFDKIYILNLHGNTLKKEVAPDGNKDENVFNIKQGVSINIFIKTTNKNKPKPMLYDEYTSKPQVQWKTYTNTPKCKVCYFDFYGKRKDKYRFLYENTLDSIAWATLQPKAPFYLFIPQNEDLRVEYDKGFSVKDIFKVYSTGICSQRDSIVIHKTRESIETLIQSFCNKSKDEIIKKYNIQKDGRDWQIQRAIDSVKKSEKNKIGVITRIHYKPFDYYWTYFNGESRAFMAYPRTEVMQHFLQDSKNIGLISNRSVALNDFNHSFITNEITDLHILETANASAYIFPLYLYPTSSAIKTLQKANYGNMFANIESHPFEDKERVENFTSEFRTFIDSKYQEHFRPEQILGYIYAVLFHKDYKEKYIDFLKIDFPQIPFVKSKERFLKLSRLGQKLIDTHLFQNDKLNSTLSKSEYKDEKNQNKKIEKIAYDPKEQKLFVNENLHFCGVSEAVWEYKIGGYQVLDKYLKSHKGEEIDHAHFSRVIQTLHRSLEIEKQIAKIDIFQA